MVNFDTTRSTKKRGEYDGQIGSSPLRSSSDIYKELPIQEQTDSPESQRLRESRSTSQTGSETAELLLNHAVYTFGIPKVILSDQGTQFVSKIWKSILDYLGIDQRLATPRHAQTNGQTERMNGILKQRLTALCSDQP